MPPLPSDTLSLPPPKSSQVLRVSSRIFKASHIYKLSFRKDKAIQRNPASTEQTRKHFYRSVCMCTSWYTYKGLGLFYFHCVRPRVKLMMLCWVVCAFISTPSSPAQIFLYFSYFNSECTVTIKDYPFKILYIHSFNLLYQY